MILNRDHEPKKIKSPALGVHSGSTWQQGIFRSRKKRSTPYMRKGILFGEMIIGALILLAATGWAWWDSFLTFVTIDVNVVSKIGANLLSWSLALKFEEGQEWGQPLPSIEQGSLIKN